MAKSHPCVKRKLMANSRMSKKPAQEPVQPQDKYVLRMPDGMRDRIKLAADQNGRSMNAEIIASIESSGEVDRLRAELLAKDAEIKTLSLRRQAAFDELMLRMDLDVGATSDLMKLREALNNRAALMEISESATKALFSAQETFSNLAALIARYVKSDVKIDPTDLAADYLEASSQWSKEASAQFWEEIKERYEIRINFWKAFADEIEALKAKKVEELKLRAARNKSAPLDDV